MVNVNLNTFQFANESKFVYKIFCEFPVKQQRKLQYSKVDIQERTRVTKRDFFIQQHDQQLLQLERQLRSTDKLIDQINKQIAYTETLITVNERLLATGDIRLVDFILALSNYFNAKNLVAQNYISRLKIINQLNYWVR